jgi:tol-pal system protein YbgF
LALNSVTTKPVVSTGFFFSAWMLLQPPLVLAQDYIDVEAEREAARREAAQTPSSSPSIPSPSAIYPAENTSGGIRPYSGQTTAAVAVDAVSDGTSGAVSGVSSDVGALVVQLQQLQEEVRRLNGIVEEQAAQLQRLKAQSLERYIDIDRRMAELAGAPQGGDVTPAPIGAGDTGGLTFGGSGGGVSQQVPLQPGEEAAYQSAYGYVKARNFAEAVKAFQAFLAKFPLGQYAPNAHYWLGELYLVVEPPDPELARQSFKLLLDQYPDNPKVPDSLYKLGKVHYLKGNSERSREYLDQVVATYPGHPAAQLARDFLADNF